MSTIAEREAAARSTVIGRLKEDNARQERAIVELEDTKQHLLRQRAALLTAAKAADKSGYIQDDECRIPLVVIDEIRKAVAFAEGETESPEGGAA
jgi:hypothetical protein